MSDLIVIAIAQAKPGYEAALVQAQAELVAVVRQLPGCISYELNESLEQPGRVVFVERWRDRAAWETHMRGPHMDAFRSKAGSMIGAFDLLQMRQVA
ncbi:MULTISPECIES: putative quinol monooxygenase [unclassified Lysobacter]|uniref:putative quinol monooxygenase n=1 Tax=unclassified Lysobacter TaxID=2635362 RepID=UPI0006F65176|nr:MULTISPECIES: putative quinol monooxygenase [unclassified Lysobacter]KQZ56770.1 antibiotic biosynthesis monooxygenase [Lysobacter sp. Root559]KRA81707.1 antibiotic biosynthesis monooxygenase [Lysobacter sp. Root667]KRC34611.1 antibiotic biosynthesis monooxygenase [Lysobacter sp. Root76]KRD70300.1 antibiotic biosynthesis monooxygenase [Lysobacter sp. Root96]